MQIAIKIVVGLLALLLLTLGLGAMFNPGAAPAQFGVEVLGIVGLSTLRGDVGGMFVGSAVLLIWGIAQGRTLLFLAVAVIMAAIAVGRLIGFVVDGANVQVITAFVIEVVMVVVLVFAHVRIGNGAH